MRLYAWLDEVETSPVKFRLTTRCGKCWGTGLCPTCRGATAEAAAEGEEVRRCPDCWDPRARRNSGQCPRCQGLGEEMEVL